MSPQTWQVTIPRVTGGSDLFTSNVMGLPLDFAEGSGHQGLQHGSKDGSKLYELELILLMICLSIDSWARLSGCEMNPS